MHLFLVRTTYDVHIYQICHHASMDWLAVSDGWALVSDGWAQVGDGWANAHPGPTLGYASAD